MSANIHPAIRKRKVWPILLMLIAIPLLLFRLLPAAPKPTATVPPIPPTATVDCLSNWSNDPGLIKAVIERCGYEKMTRTVNEEEQQLQTAQAVATLSSAVPLPVGTLFPFPLMTPQRLLPQPEDTKIIRPLVITDTMGYSTLHCIMRGATSQWLAGSVPDNNYSHWWPLYIATRPGNGESTWSCGEGTHITIETNPTLEVFPAFTIDGSNRYYHTWTSPKPVKAITITGITSADRPGLNADGNNFFGLNYIVHFSTKTGESGQFDMTTQTWTWTPAQP